MYDEKSAVKNLGNLLFKKPNLVLPWLKMPTCGREYAGPKILTWREVLRLPKKRSDDWWVEEKIERGMYKEKGDMKFSLGRDRGKEKAEQAEKE